VVSAEGLGPLQVNNFELQIVPFSEALERGVFRDAYERTFKDSMPDVEFQADLFVLCVDKESNEAFSFLTIQSSKAHAFIEYGGTFHQSVGAGLESFKSILEWMRAEYGAVSMLVKNTNVKMGRLAYASGFIPTGITLVDEKLFLEWRLV